MYPRIRDLREDRDLTQTQVAKMLSMSQTGYSKYETGENDIPTAILSGWRASTAPAWITCSAKPRSRAATRSSGTGRSERRSAARYVPYRKKAVPQKKKPPVSVRRSFPLRHRAAPVMSCPLPASGLSTSGG